MRKIILIAFGVIFLGNIVYAQKVYFKINPSYTFATKNRYLRDQSLRYQVGFEKFIETTTNIKSGFGKGYLGNFTVGFINNKNLSTELSFSYLRGRTTTSTDVNHYYYGDESWEYNLSANVFSFTPSLVFSFGSDKWSPYISAGLSLNFTTLYEKIVHEYYLQSGPNYYDIEYKGGPSLGFTTKLGSTIQINDRFSIFGEMQFAYFRFSPKTGERTKYIINSEDMLSTLTEYELKTEYEDEVATTYVFVNNNWEEDIDDSKPRVHSKFDLPMSFFAVSIGVKMDIGKRTIDPNRPIE